MNLYTVTPSSTFSSVTAIVPALVTFDMQYVTTPNDFAVSKLVYDFGDGSATHTAYSSNSANAIDVPVTHSFYRAASSDSNSVTATVVAFEYNTFQTKQYDVAFSLNLPAFPAVALYPLELRAFADRILTVNEQCSVSSGNVFANIIVPASATPFVTTAVAATCVDPTPLSNLSVTITAPSQAVLGTSVAASAVSGTLVFVSDQGNYNSQYYTSIATAVNSIVADGYLFGGNNNYPYGGVASRSSSWSGYNSLRVADKCYPALGTRDQMSTGVMETVVSDLLLDGDQWKYSISAGNTLSYTPTAVLQIEWYQDQYNDTSWAVGNSPIGYMSGGYIVTAIASTVPLTANCAQTLPVTGVYARNTFSVIASDLVGADAVRIKYQPGAAVAIYINEVLVVTDNVELPYTQNAPNVICAQLETTPTWRSAYAPLSCINVGTNTIAVRTMQHPNDPQRLYFDASVATVDAPGIVVSNAAYGASQTQYFEHLPGNRRYYDVVLPGDVHLFVLNSGVNSLYPCTRIVEPDGVAIGSEQYQWFVQTIKASTSRWKIVMFHTANIGSTNTLYSLFREFDWGFDSLGVNLILNGGLGINEHCIRNNINYVNCSANTVSINPVPFICQEAVWTDIVENNNLKGEPAIVKLTANQSQLQVDFIRAASMVNIHSFKIV